MERKTPAERARDQLRSQVTAASATAEVDWRHPGHWHLHHIALPTDGPGDFTPYRAPEYAEHGLSPLAFLERLAEILGPDQPGPSPDAASRQGNDLRHPVAAERPGAGRST